MTVAARAPASTPFPTSSEALMARLVHQREQVPLLYGTLPLDTWPERYTEDMAQPSVLMPAFAHRRETLLRNRELVERIRTYTFMGDVVADAYACLIPSLGFRKLVDMLALACDRGVEAVPDAPPELHAFVREMEGVPDWVDMDLVAQGARASRNSMAHIAPLVIRGAFFGTFTNQYTALPMALTGALSNETSGRRVLETATFFTLSTLPGALDRHGAGFKAAAQVRLMHAMVRFHALTKPGLWNTQVYGIPIPQVDQMPAGLISAYLVAQRALQRPGQQFTPDERAQVELARYRCHLLGLPAELLPDTPQALVDVLQTRHATLRAGFDDATCGALIRSTMAADLGRDPGWAGGVRARCEPSVARLFFVRNFMGGDFARAERIGVTVSRRDKLRAAVGMGLGVLTMAPYALAQRVPGVRAAADRRLVRKLGTLLQRYGHADFTTDAAHYRPGATAAAQRS
ncbi:hypothetical protein CCO03_17340 [Comamonas serinivorans]|uniref:Uncharacterized protein n=1 Tax=Comamonas serinivorans TaxID=1082851 RepID=A0A1Y0ERB5_9BURK|nr:oxygenase MpaB family protein [Comamonas serinivorans]ARU06204.1 hypothetical protein CCO03_17340 [Comamonas serinivorans]